MSAPRADSYDAVVVGAGLGGLAAAAALAMAGRRVLVAERHEGVGGAARTFFRGPYGFDPAIHVMALTAPGRIVGELLRWFEVGERCELAPLERFYTAVLPGLKVAGPADPQQFAESYASAFAGSGPVVAELVRMCDRISREIRTMPQNLELWELDEAAGSHQLLFRYRRATVDQVLADLTPDPRLRSALAAIWPYLGLPPSRLAFVQFAQALNGHLDSCSYSMGGFYRVAEAVRAAIEARGGEVLTEAPVARVLLEQGRAAGIELASGATARAPIVISNIDAFATFDRLVGTDALPPGFAARLHRMRPSLSAFAVYLAARVDAAELDLTHETFVSPHWDRDLELADIMAGRPGGAWINSPSQVDPTLAPPGESVFIVSSMARHDLPGGWEAARPGFTEAMLDLMEGAVPGIRDRLTHLETATPLTMERFLGTTGGAIYGWENSPRQTGSGRLAHVTPIPGLFLTGAWTHPGSGSTRCLVSGLITAQIALAMQGEHLETPLDAAMVPPT